VVAIRIRFEGLSAAATSLPTVIRPQGMENSAADLVPTLHAE